MKIWQILENIFWGFVMSWLLQKVKMPFILNGGLVFLIHPRVLKDVSLEFPFLRILTDAQLMWLFKHLPPVIGPTITGVDGKKGRVVYVPWTINMMLDDMPAAETAIIRAAQTAANMGAERVGTGAMNASMTRLGTTIRIENLLVSTGHTTTMLFGSRILLESLIRIGIDPKQATVAVVGAGGNIGGTLAYELGGKVARVILIDLERRTSAVKRMHKLTAKLAELGTEAEVALVERGGYGLLKQADAVFTATSMEEPFLLASMLAPWAVVVDDSAPFAISAEEAAKHSGVVMQVLANMPGVDTHRWFSDGVGRQGIHYTCLAELAALAIAGPDVNLVGKVDQDKIKFVQPLLEAAGYEPVFMSFGREVTEVDWQRCRDAREGVIAVLPQLRQPETVAQPARRTRLNQSPQLAQ